MKLHDYQLRIIDFCLTHPKALLSVDMGLGKTISVLTYMDRLRPSTAVIVAPKRVAESGWLQEAQKWGLDYIADKMVIVKGTKANRAKALSDTSKPYKVVSRDNLNDIVGYECDLLVLDELTSFKSPTSNRSNAVQSIRANRIVGLTGTFLANGAIDIFGQAQAVGLNLCGGNYWVWRAMHFRDALSGSGLQFQKWVAVSSVEEILAPIRDNIFTLSAADYLNIPKVSHITHPVELTIPERNAYDDADAFLSFDVGDGNIVDVREQAKFCKLQTLCNGFVYDGDGAAIRLKQSSKLNAVADFCASAVAEGESVLLFYAYVEEAKWLFELLKARHLNVDSAKANGFLERWNSGETDVLMAHPASAGHGLNLQFGGRIVVWSSLTYNYEYYAQANARLARQGQTKPVHIHYFVAQDTVEQRQVKALANKDKNQQEFINLTKQ